MGDSTADSAHASGGESADAVSRTVDKTLPKVEALGNTVGRGASWVLLGNVLGKLAALVTQVVLGIMLTDVEYGVYATAAAMGWFVSILKDAGANNILLQRGAAEYNNVAGPLFWINSTLATACSLVIVGIGVVMSYRQPQYPEMAWILYIIALSTPLQVVGGQLQTQLRQDPRFAECSQIQLYRAV
ncbi:lipopolysaccharide biosynthesis protein, partial [Limnofasciculus baicalensis]